MNSTQATFQPKSLDEIFGNSQTGWKIGNNAPKQQGMSDDELDKLFGTSSTASIHTQTPQQTQVHQPSYMDAQPNSVIPGANLPSIQQGDEELQKRADSGDNEAGKQLIMNQRDPIHAVGKFFGDTGSALAGGTKQLFHGLQEGLEAGQEFGQTATNSPLMTGEKQGSYGGVAKKLLRGTGDVLGGGMQVGFSPQGAAIEALPPVAGGAIKGVLSIPSHVTGAATEAIGKAMGVDTTTPDFQENFVQPMQNVVNAFLAANPELVAKGVKGAGEIAGKGLEVAGNVAGKVVGGVAKGAGDLGKSGLSLASGLSRDTITAALENPELLSEAQKTGIEGSRDNAFNMIKNPIDEKIADLSDTGKAYQPIREGGQIVDLPKDYLKTKLQDAGLNIDEKGQIKGTSKSLVRNTGEISKIQDFYNMYNKSKLGSDEFLNMREDLANLAKYESGKTTQLQDFSRNLRNSVNNDLRPQIGGLEDLDNKYSSTVKDLKKVKDLIYDSKGNLKDNAVSAVNNLLNKAKGGKFAKLQEALPDLDIDKFAQQVKVSKALEDIQITKSVKVGAYAHNVIAGGAALTGNIPAALGSVLTHPTILIPILKAFGEISGKSSDFVAGVTSKIMDGIKPADGEVQFVQDALKKTSSGTLKKLIPQVPDKDKTNV